MKKKFLTHMKSWFGFFFVLLLLASCEKIGQGEELLPDNELDPAINFSRFNYFAGTQTIGYKYNFTADHGLLETAKRIRGMGSNTIKFAISGGEKNPDLSGSSNTLVGWLSDVEEFRSVMEMDFKYYFFWAYGPSWFEGGITQTGISNEYQAIYDLTEYLLTEYNNSGKVFYIGHWEGDWHLYPEYDLNILPSQATIEGMTKWYETRQKAVDDAKSEIAHQDVEVYHYAEVNKAVLGMQGGPSIARDILPNINVDYVSYSCYDVIYNHFEDTASLRTALHDVLDYLEGQLPEKASIQGKRIFIGEYGFALKYCEGEQQQKLLTKNFLRAATEWGCPFSLYWAFYCNERQSNGSYNGFWMIDDKDIKQPVYFFHEDYYKQLKLKIQSYIRKNNEDPDTEQIRQFALSLL